MTDADIKAAIHTIEIHHELDWWIATIPNINVATQAKTLPELGVEVERIIVAHFETAKELGTDPFRNKRPSVAELTKTLNVVLEARTATFSAIAQALRKIEQRVNLLVTDETMLRRRGELQAVQAAIAAVATLVETPLTAKVPEHGC